MVRSFYDDCPRKNVRNDIAVPLSTLNFLQYSIILCPVSTGIFTFVHVFYMMARICKRINEMSKKFDWMKRSLMGSTTMSLSGSVLPHSHIHNADGSCCGHHHHHVHDEHCGHDHGESDDHTNPKGECC